VPAILADEWSSGSDDNQSGPVPVNILAALADNWSSSSQSSNLDPTKIADRWSSDSDEPAPAPEEISTPPMPPRSYGPDGLATPPVPHRVYSAQDFSYIQDFEDSLFDGSD
jgi:hypothetical protein